MALTTDIQSVATTTQFDGSAAKGLINFVGAEIDGYTAVIYSLGFTPGAATSAWTIDLQHPSGAASGNVNILDGAAAVDASVYDVRIVVPKVSSTSSFDLVVTTTGKTGNGVITVVWGVEPMEG